MTGQFLNQRFLVQAKPSFYEYTEYGNIYWNPEHVNDVLKGKAGINEVASSLGVYRDIYKREFNQMRLGKGVANLRVG